METSDAASVTPTVTTTASTSTGPTTRTPWSGAHINLSQLPDDLRDMLLLDTGSSTTIFCNNRLMDDIHEVEIPMDLKTNGGELITNKKGTVPGFGEGWFKKSSMTNIMSFAELKDKFRITYDSNREDAFCVHLPDKIV